jgi:hypothetical protein
MRFLLKNQTYDSNKRYYLVIEDNDTGETIEMIQFVIDIVGFKMF